MGLAVVGAGFGRTGTLSLKQALETLGFGPCHHMVEVMASTPDADAWTAAATGDLANWDRLYAGWGSAVDFPHCVFYRELAAFYPDALVVLSVRDADDWYASASSTIFSPDNLRRFSAAPDPAEVDPRRRTMAAIGAIVSRVVDVSAGADRESMIADYERHNAEVRATIPAERLLVHRVGDGWEPLCAFLGVPVPDEPFPRTNSRAEFQARRAARRPDGGGEPRV